MNHPAGSQVLVLPPGLAEEDVDPWGWHVRFSMEWNPAGPGTSKHAPRAIPILDFGTWFLVMLAREKVQKSPDHSQRPWRPL